MKNSPFSYSVKTSKSGGYPVITMNYVPAKKSEKPLSISIAPTLGSNMFAWRYGDHDIIYHEPAVLKQRGFTGNFVLFPTPNRVRNYSYTWKGRAVPMKKRRRTVEIHGLVFDEPWDYKTPVVKNNCISLQTSIAVTRKSDLFNAYPFPCILTLEYILYPNKVKVTYTVKNTGTSALPFGFGMHPYFSRLSGDTKTSISVAAASWMESPDDTLLPTGKLIPVAGKPYDIRKPTPLSKLHLDHVYTTLTKKGVARVIYNTLGFSVQIRPTKDFTHYVVYTGHKKAVCIENQTCSTDAINLWGKGYKKESHLLTVRAGGTKKGAIIYEIKAI